MKPTANGLEVDAELSGYAPRMPGPLYLKSQEPMHRAVVDQAVGAVAQHLGLRLASA